MACQETFLTLHGLKIQLLLAGSGEPLLYLHGVGGEVEWLPFFAQLSRACTLYVPAHPGFRKSEGLEKIDTIEDLVFHYTDLMDHLGLTQPYVVGLSLGGWLAAELATRYSHRIRKLVLIDAVGLRVPGAPIADIFAATPEETRQLLFHDPQSELARRLVPDVPSPQLLENTLRAREATARVGWNPLLCNPKLRERLYRITVPTLVIWGESDRLVPAAHGRAYQEGIAGAKLVVLEHCGHMPPLEKPEETARVVTQFLRA
ncbi:MAG: alpha/beta fold hydrolase [Candidatus Binatia bacterium]|nr:alpha/beta fold hydrolase [Candidatus Binatia bacterium]